MNKDECPGSDPRATERLITDYTELKTRCRGHWREILASLGIDSSFLRNRQGPCPVCGGKDRFRFDDLDGTGTWICNRCGSGNAWKLLGIYHGWTFGESYRRVLEVLRIAPAPTASPYVKVERANRKFDLEAKQAIDRTWAESVPVTEGDPAWTYLVQTRGLKLQRIPSELRLHPECETRLLVGRYVGPTMIAAVRNSKGALIQVHKTLLTSDGQKPSLPLLENGNVQSSKRLMQSPHKGITNGGAIRLFEPTEILGIGEGLESSIAAHLRFGVPVWSAISAIFLTKVEIPETVDEVWIFADNDQSKADTGYVAAISLARSLLVKHKRVRIYEPKQPGADFADLVR